MTRLTANGKGSWRGIDGVAVTSDRLTSRGGLSLFVRYLRNIGLVCHLQRLFGSIRKSAKGQPVAEIFKQLFCFFLDGTSRHLVEFDRRKEDRGYAATMETAWEAMLSSHGIKRFLCAFSWPRIWLFRRLLQALFLWRLRLTKPEAIVLGIDTMVMDNDEAEKRHGVQPTYKKLKGFQPLQMTWERYVVDAVFRGGRKHSNHGDTVAHMVRHMVQKIRQHYREDVGIVVRMDSGFFDQKLFELFEELSIGYQCTGKLYDDVKAYVGATDEGGWGRYQNGEQAWDYLEFGDRRGNWSRFRRAIFCRPVHQDQQMLLSFARPESLLYTNLGMGQPIDEQLKRAGLGHWLTPEWILECAHGRGRDELVHRGLKDFGPETLPMKRFAPNAVFYYTMLVAFFLYECFKEDVCAPVVPIGAYATTLRRKVIDVAAKIVRTSGKTILKVTAATWRHLHIEELWLKSGHPPHFAWT
jgi:hypothetical protein